jgi:hypothetical protein
MPIVSFPFQYHTKALIASGVVKRLKKWLREKSKGKILLGVGETNLNHLID